MSQSNNKIDGWGLTGGKRKISFGYHNQRTFGTKYRKQGNLFKIFDKFNNYWKNLGFGNGDVVGVLLNRDTSTVAWFINGKKSVERKIDVPKVIIVTVTNK